MTAHRRQLHIAEYAIEGGALGSFMLSACLFGALIFHPDSPVRRYVHAPLAMQATMGVLMGLTLVTLVYSPWGRRSGAQMNPAFTLTFYRLGKIAPADAAGYIVAQFVGGALGVALSATILRMMLSHPSVNYVVTRPGRAGTVAAFAAEVGISFLQMLLVLTVSSSKRWARYTGVCAAIAVATYITLESPISGMSMNPARTVASAVVSGEWHAIWIYFAAPLAGMSLAAALFTRRMGRAAVPCGKLMHATPCLFCDYAASTAQRQHAQEDEPERGHPHAPERAHAGASTHVHALAPEHARPRTPEHVRSRTPEHARSRTPEHAPAGTHAHTGALADARESAPTREGAAPFGTA